MNIFFTPLKSPGFLKHFAREVKATAKIFFLKTPVKSRFSIALALLLSTSALAFFAFRGIDQNNNLSTTAQSLLVGPYISATSGTWTVGTTWVGGMAPPTTLSAGDTVIIDADSVFLGGVNLINNGGAIYIINDGKLQLGTGVNVENKGFFEVNNASLVQFRFVGGGDSGVPQSGTFKNQEGGYFRCFSCYIEVAQDWVNESGARRLHQEGCMYTGQNYIISGPTTQDTMIDVCLSIGWHGSGNFQLADGTLVTQGSKVQLNGTSGNFELNSGTIGEISPGVASSLLTITMANPANLGGIIVGTASVTGNMTLPIYCLPGPPAQFQNGAGVFINGMGMPVENCAASNALFPCDCDFFDICDECIPPDITVCPAGDDLGCNPMMFPLPTPGGVLYTGDCPDLLVTADTLQHDTLNCLGTLVYRYIVTDSCENADTCLQTFTYTVDNQGPTTSTCDDGEDLGCNPDPAEYAADNPPTWSDNCGVDTSGVTAGTPVNTQGCTWSVTHKYWAVDTCQNTSDTCFQTFTWIVDTTPPSITAPENSIVECIEDVVFGDPIVTDNCQVTDLTFSDMVGMSFTDTLSGAQEAPVPVVTPGTGTLTGGIDTATNMFFICVEFSGLLGPTTAAHIHLGAVGVAGPVVFPLPVPVGVTAGEFSFSGPITDMQEADLLAGLWYVNIHTSTFPSGEIRGQLHIIDCGVTIKRTWTATDTCGTSSSACATVLVVDTTPPETTNCDPGGSLGCNPATPSLYEANDPPTWTDNCIAQITTGTIQGIPSNVGCSWTVINKYWATDACNNSDTCFQIFTWSIDDALPPITTNCDPGGPLPCNPMPAAYAPDDFPTWTDDCGVDTSGVTAGTPINTQGCNWSVTHKYWAIDNCQNTSDTCYQTFTWIEDDLPPTTTNCDPGADLGCNPITPSLYSPDDFPTWTDNCGVDTSGVTAGTPINTQGCTWSVTHKYWAVDTCQNTSDTCYQTFTWTVDMAPPTTMCPPGGPLGCNPMPLAYAPDDFPTWTDNCGVDTSGVTAGTPVNTMGCNWTVTHKYWAVDTCQNTSDTCYQTFTWIEDDLPPTTTNCDPGADLGCNPITPSLYSPDDFPTWTDNCGVDTSGVTAGTPINTQGCTWSVTHKYWAVDTCQNTSDTCYQTFTWTVDMAPPTTMCPPGGPLGCNPMPLAYAPDDFPTWTDNCGVDTSGVTAGTPVNTMGCNWTVTHKYWAVDTCQNTSDTCIQTFTWIVDLLPPEISCPEDITLDPGSSTDPVDTGGPATGTDNCGDPIIDFVDEITQGECEGAFTILRTWSATDVCQQTVTCVQTIVVEGLCEVDLELEKTADLCVVQAGDLITFTITVTNEGEVSIGSVTITDYIPTGLMLSDPDWTAGTEGSTGQSASIELTVGDGLGDGLDAGESVMVDITLLVLDGASGELENIAEISAMEDLLGNDVSDSDVDSDPDTDDQNDLPGEDDIDAQAICIPPQTEIEGDGYVCPGDIVTYCLTTPYNPENTYSWSLPNGGGVIIENNDSCITVQWQNTPGGPFLVWLTESTGTPGCAGECVGEADLVVYIQGLDPIACNDHLNISLGPDCELVLLSGMILEGEAEGNDTYFVVIKDQDGNIIPDATLNGDHVGQMFTVMVMNECNGQSCWGTIWIEDKLPPQITCTDVTLNCGESTEPVFISPISGTTEANASPGSAITDFNTTTQNLLIVTPADAEVTDVNISITLTHSWSEDLDVFLEAPDGTMVELATDVCGSQDNWNVTFDDEGGTTVTAACIIGTPALSGTVQPEGFLSDFDGLDAAGTWTLHITDDAAGDVGTLNSVILSVSYFVQLPYAAEAFDACGDVELDYSDEVIGELCEEGYGIIRTWTATDESGNTTTCEQTITILPLSLDDLEFPENYQGSCGGSSHPNVTGWPTVDGVEITGGFICNIFLTWEDKPLADCGAGTKIIRRWTVLDWCEVEIAEGVQIIKLIDDEAPWLECPDDHTVGSNPWFCETDVILYPPDAEDHCGTPFELIPSVSAGVLVYFPNGNFWRVDELPLGTHTVTWTATDDCGNSSTCSYELTVEDDVPPVAICDEHTILALTFDDPLDEGLTKLHAITLDDGSYDNCGPVTFLARRMDSCIDFDWIGLPPQYGEYPNNDGGLPESLDQGLTLQEWVPFACCDVGHTRMVELRVTDQYGNFNTCMVEVEVQDKLPPLIVCPPDITVSCEFWFDAQETDGFEPTDGMEDVFGRVLDAHENDESDREWIIIDDPNNHQLPQPYHWGLDGWADDNCDVTVTVNTDIDDDCSGDLPGNPPNGAVRLITRTFRAQDAQGNTRTCTQRIWVIDFDPFDITDTQCGLNNSDDVRWPCDLTLTDCPEGELTPENLSAYAPNNRPIVNDDNCSIVGVTYEDQIFYFVDDACYKIIRTWTVIDWCQFELDGKGGHYGYWTYVQVIKVHDEEGPEFLDCPDGPVTYCVEDPNVELPSNNQVFLGESNPNSSSCSAHVWESRTVYETCSDQVIYDVKIYPFNGTEYVQIVEKTTVFADSNGQAVLTWDTRNNSLSSNHSIRKYGLPYNDRLCSNWPFAGGEKDYHRVLWSVEDGCGNLSTCEYLFRLEDCKQPTPICVGLSSVVMPSTGSVTIWAADFDSGSSVDDCTSHDYLLFSFSGTSYQPSRDFDCDAIVANGSPSFLVEIWVADEGNDLNCSGRTLPLVGVNDTTGIQYNERNKDFCTTFIVIDDNEGVCGDSLTGGVIETEEFETVEKVSVKLTDQNGQVTNTYVTDKDGLYHFINPLFDYIIEPSRNDGHKNGVSTLDLVAIQKHLLGLQPLNSPYKMIAADANNSESVSALDLVEIRKLILGLYTEFPKNTSWRFVDAGFEFVDPNHPWPFDEVIESHSGMTMQEDFIGVKVGDVNGTVVANATQITTRGARKVLQLQIEDSEVKEGETIQVAVTSENYESMLGYQFTMNLSGLKYEGIEGGAIAMQSEFVGVHKSAITMSWGETAERTASNETLFTIQFTSTANGSLKDMLEISSEITEAEAYTSTGEEIELLDVTLVFGKTEVEGVTEFALYQNEPNPFSDQTVIGFGLPEAMPATLTLYDMSGRVIRVVKGDYAKGYNEIVLKRKDMVTDGAYYYHLQAGDFSASKKMILSK